MSFRRPVMATFGASGFLPLGFTFVLAIVMLLPIGTGLANVTMPHLVMISVFYWMTHRPLLMPYGACAILGFFLDLWLAVPLGLNMLLLLLTRLFIINQLKYFRGRSRFVYMSVFSGMSLGLFLLAWLVMSVVKGQMLSVRPVLLQWLITAFAYAPVGLLLSRMRRLLM